MGKMNDRKPDIDLKGRLAACRVRRSFEDSYFNPLEFELKVQRPNVDFADWPADLSDHGYNVRCKVWFEKIVRKDDE